MSRFERRLGLASDVVSLSSAAVAAMVAVLGAWALLPSWGAYVVGVAVAALTGVALGASATSVRQRRRGNLGYGVVRVEQTYELDESNPREQRLVSRVTIEATRDNVFLFADRTQWTGVVPPALSALSPGHTLMSSPRSFEGWRNYAILLDVPLMRGEQAELVMEARFYEVGDDTSHWVAKTPLEPIRESLLLEIRMGANSPGAHAYSGSIMRPGVGRGSMLEKLSPSFDPVQGLARVRVTNPSVGRRYHLQVDYRFPTPDEGSSGRTAEPDRVS